MRSRKVIALLGAVVFIALGFSITQPAKAAVLSPTVNSVTPSQIVPGVNNQVVTLHGDFTSGTTKVTFDPGGDIHQVGSTVTSSDQTTVTVTVNVDATAANSARDVTATGGLLNSSNTCSKCITVGPDISSVTGPIANTNAAAGFTISGHAFKAPVTVTLSRSGYGFGATETDSVLASNVTVTGTTQISGTVNMFGRAPGRWKVSISQDNGGKASFGDGVTTGLQVTGSKPTISSMSPTRINSNETGKLFTLTGANFAQGMTATVSDDGVTQSSKIVLGSNSGTIDPTHATLHLTASSSASTGSRTLVLRNADGQSSTNADALCVNCDLAAPGTPTIGNVSPTIVGQGASQLQMIVTGTNFGSPVPTVTVSNAGTGDTGITLTTTRDSATQLTLSLTVGANAPAAAHDLTVTNPNGGGTATKVGAFSVSTAFNVTSLNPPGRAQGFSGVVAINGSGFSATPSLPTVQINPATDINVGSVAVDSPARIKFQVQVGPTAATTARDVIVTQNNVSKTCTGCFVVGKQPVLDPTTPITPNAATGGAPASITAIKGNYFVAGAVATLERTDQPTITMTETSVDSPTQISGTFDLTNAAPGTWNLRVTNADGGTATKTGVFEVTQAAPTVGDVSPQTIEQKSQATLTLTGTAFSPGMTVTFPGSPGLTVDDVTRTSNTSAAVKVTAGDNAPLGSTDVKVTNTDGQSGTCTSCLTVVQGPQAHYFGPGVTAYENFNGGAFVAAGNLDGVASNGVEFVTSPNTGGGPHIKPYRINPANGAVQELGPGFMAYDQSFLGGVHVAMGNIDGVGGDEIITAAGPGGGPHVRVWHVNNDLSVSEPFGGGFFAYPGFGGGVFVGAGDVDGDGKDEIITGAGPGGGPHVIVWKLNDNGQGFHPIGSWMAYDPAFNGGVAVAAGNFVPEASDAAVRDEVVTVPSLGGGPHVRVFNSSGQVQREFLAFSAADPLGYRVAAGDFDHDSVDDLAVSQVSTSYVMLAQLVDPPTQFRRMVPNDQQPLGSALSIGTNMAAADVDGDGDDDLIVAPDHNSAVTIRVTRPLS